MKEDTYLIAAKICEKFQYFDEQLKLPVIRCHICPLGWDMGLSTECAAMQYRRPNPEVINEVLKELDWRE